MAKTIGQMERSDLESLSYLVQIDDLLIHFDQEMSMLQAILKHRTFL